MSESAAAKEQVSKALPIGHKTTPMHGGLALRDFTVSSDELTLTLDTDMGSNFGMGRNNTGMEQSRIGMEQGTMGMEQSRMGMEAGDLDSGDTGVEGYVNSKTSPHPRHPGTSTPTKGSSLIVGGDIPLHWEIAGQKVTSQYGWQRVVPKLLIRN